MKKPYRVPLFIVLLPFLHGCASTAKQQHFASPADAAQALVGAVRSNDEPQLKQILGTDCDGLLCSGDDVADRQDREKFLAAYDTKHELLEGKEPDAPATILVGENDWPFPIPIVKQKSGWYFDTTKGKDEIVCRRIGRNELSAIQVCLAIGDAEHDYAHRDPEGTGIPVYAQKILSDVGKRNGLYWHTEEGEPPSPLGELVAQASGQGYTAARDESGKPAPYHGYHYRILKSQGPDAPGGALDYVVNGKMIGGFAVVAWPDQYGNSGITTFIVNHDGVVYQKDLGPDTRQLAQSMTAYDPGSGWTKVE